MAPKSGGAVMSVELVYIFIIPPLYNLNEQRTFRFYRSLNADRSLILV